MHIEVRPSAETELGGGQQELERAWERGENVRSPLQGKICQAQQKTQLKQRWLDSSLAISYPSRKKAKKWLEFLEIGSLHARWQGTDKDTVV